MTPLPPPSMPRYQRPLLFSLCTTVPLLALPLYLFNPSTHAFFPPCLFHLATGLYCPGCGATRAAHHLLHGHLLTALHYNALLTLSLPFLAFSFTRFASATLQKRPFRDLRFPLPLLLALAALTLAFTLLRNLPGPFAFLAPPP